MNTRRQESEDERSMDAWKLGYSTFVPEQEGLREALCTLGNGYFCTRGAAPEAAAGDVHYPGTYLAGVYNRLRTEIAGEIIENEDLVNVPNWLPLSFRIEDGDWFRPGATRMLDYRQELDLRQGLLTRDLRFEDAAGRITRCTFRRLVHMACPHLAAQEMTLTPENWSGTIEIRSALDGRVVNNGVARYRDLNNRHLEPVAALARNETELFLAVRTRQSRIEIAQAARTRILSDGCPVPPDSRAMRESAYAAHVYRVSAREGTPILAEKVIALFTSRDPAISECGIEARKAVARAGSFATLLRTHAMAWRHLWDTLDITFEDTDPRRGSEVGLSIHLHIFHLLQTCSINTMSMDLDVGVPPRGWHGEAYRGHILWDELFVFPYLNLRLPEITRSLLMYRYRRLDEAKASAKQAGYEGAMYPWQSGSNGREESQRIHLNPRSGRWIPDHSRLQRHVNAAIVYNIRDYFEATNDMEFLSFYGAEMVLEIGRFWASLTRYNEELGRYEILGVMGPDEYHEGYPDRDTPGLDNNAYTNVMAVWSLRQAARILEILPKDTAAQLRERVGLGDGELQCWQDITRKMRVPFQDGIISQFDGYERLDELDWDAYREQYGNIQRLDRLLKAEGDTPDRYKVSKQADVLMLFYLFSAEELHELFADLGYALDGDTIPRNIDYYLKRTSHGSTLSWLVHARVLVRRDRARSWNFFRKALRSDVADIQGGTTPEGIHLGAMAGSVDILQRGYPEIVTRDGVLRMNPCLPKGLNTLCLSLRYRGYSLRLTVYPDCVEVRTLGAKTHPIKVGCGGMVKTLCGEASETFRIRPESNHA